MRQNKKTMETVVIFEGGKDEEEENSLNPSVVIVMEVVKAFSIGSGAVCTFW